MQRKLAIAAAAGGGLSIQALRMAIPGGAGTAMGAASTGNRSSELLRDQRNRQYTPTDLLIMASSLSTLRARGTALFVARAAEAVARDEAYSQRVRAELLGRHGRRLGVTEFVAVGGFPLNRLRDGRIISVFPFDQLA